MDSKNKIEELEKKINQLENQLLNQKDKKKTKKTEILTKIYKWKAPNRIYINHTKSWYIIVSIIAIITILTSLLTENFILVVVVITVIILLYAINSVPPTEIEHEITNLGIKTNENLIYWKDIEYFWITERSQQKILNIELKEHKGRKIYIIGKGNLEKIAEELLANIEYRTPKGFEGFISNFTEGKAKNITDISPD